MLILMSEGFPYDQFRETWRRYMKSHPNIDCYFYQGNPNLSTNYLLEEDTLWIRLPETFPYITEKTWRAFQYFAQTRPDTYTFLYRPNASSFVDLFKYYEMCKTFPTQRFCSAVVGEYDKLRLPFPSGSGYTLSFDVVKRFAIQPNIRTVLIDDVTIGYYLRQWNIEITPALRYDITHYPPSPHIVSFIVSTHFHVRCKNEPDRNKDIEAMNMLVDRIYGKK